MPDAAEPRVRSAEVRLTIPFYDLDPLEVAWHGNYAKYFERARCVLLASIGYGYPEMKESGYVWPVIDFHVRYLQPMVFNQEIVVRAEIVEWENRLKIAYLITDAATGVRLTKGSSVQVAVDAKTKLMCLQSPAILLEKLGVSAA